MLKKYCRNYPVPKTAITPLLSPLLPPCPQKNCIPKIAIVCISANNYYFGLDKLVPNSIF